MSDNLIIYVTLNRKADHYAPEKCAVRNVIELGSHEFRELRCNLGKSNSYIAENAEMMGYYNGAFNCILFLNSDGKDGILVNSEGADNARYSQYISNARDIVNANEQNPLLEILKNRMDIFIDKWLNKELKSENKFEIPLVDLINDANLAEIFLDYAVERISEDPRIEECELTENTFEITKRGLIETRLYCPLKFQMDMDDDDGMYPIDVDSANYIDYDDEINEAIQKDVKRDEHAVERGLAAYFHDERLDLMVHSIMPMVETRNGELYGIAVVKSFDNLDDAEMKELVEYITGQFSDGWGEGFEQREIKIGGDNVYISFWNSDGGYFLKPESEVFPEQNMNLNMGGM